MKLYNIQPVEDYTLASEIVNQLRQSRCPLNNAQISELYDFYEHRKKLYEFKNTPKTNYSPWWRLTAPFFCVAFIMAALFMPIKWMLNGKWFYEFDDTKLFYKWCLRIGL